MRRYWTIPVILLGVILIAVLVLPAALRGRIGEIVRREAGARLDFRRLDISLLRNFPHATLDLKGVTLTGAGPFEADTLVSADRISVVVGMQSLFGSDGFEVRKVKLLRPVVYAHRRADGSANWHAVGRSDSQQTKSGDPLPFRFSLRDFRISEAVIRYEDDSTRIRGSASSVSLRLKGDLSASDADLRVRLKAGDIRLTSGGMTLVSGADAELDAAIRADLANRQFAFLQNTLRLNAITLSLDGKLDLSDPDAVGVDIRADCSRVQFKEALSLIPALYVRDFNNLAASGGLSLSAWVKGEVRDHSLPAFEIKLGVHDGRFQYTSLPEAVTGIQVSARLANRGGTLDSVTLDVPELSMTVAGTPLKASLAVSHPLTDLRFEAWASGRLDLAAVGRVFPLPRNSALSGLISADVRVAGRLSDIDSQRYDAIDVSGALVIEQMRARFGGLPRMQIHRAAASLSGTSMTLGELNVGVGRSDLTANGRLTGYIGYLLDGTPLSGRLYVKSELVDLNEMMAAIPASEQSGTADTAATAALIVPRNLRLSLSTDIRRVLLGKMVCTDLTGQLETVDGTATLEQLSMKAFGGSLLASGSYSTAVDARRPDLTLALDIAHASFSRTFEELEMVRRFAPLFGKTEGDYSMTLDLDAQLDAGMSPDLRTLRATGEFRSANVRIQQIGALTRLAEVLHNDSLRAVDAKDVTIRFSVADGQITTQPFDLRTGPVSLRLSGTTGLDQTIDYAARVSLPDGVAGGALSTIDVGIGGTFSAPKITLGVRQMVRDALQNLLGKPKRSDDRSGK